MQYGGTGSTFYMWQGDVSPGMCQEEAATDLPTSPSFKTILLNNVNSIASVSLLFNLMCVLKSQSPLEYQNEVVCTKTLERNPCTYTD